MAAQPPRAFIEQLMARTQGNPYFTEELVTAHAQGDALPPQLADLIAADLASCRPSTRAALAVLATIGRDTSHDLLAAILTEPEPTVERAVHEAVSYFTLYSYNFCWPVRTLRQGSRRKGYRQRTPAMAAGLADHIWTLKEWLSRPAVQRQ